MPEPTTLDLMSRTVAEAIVKAYADQFVEGAAPALVDMLATKLAALPAGADDRAEVERFLNSDPANALRRPPEPPPREPTPAEQHERWLAGYRERTHARQMGDMSVPPEAPAAPPEHPPLPGYPPGYGPSPPPVRPLGEVFAARAARAVRKPWEIAPI
jgi:hypothetical protein